MSRTSGEVQPNFEAPAEPSGYELSQEKSMEARPAAESTLGKQGSQPQQPSTQTIPVIHDQSDDGSTQPQQTTASKTDDLPAEEADRIEKQWVERAKKIVARTRDDPYKQKNEISKAGADYIKKRFNKTIPTDDAVRT